MKKRTIITRLEWDTDSPALHFIDPFVEICNYLRQHRYFHYRHLAVKYNLTEQEVIDLLGKAEEVVNQE